MAIKPRSFIRNPLLVLLLAVGAVAAGILFTCPGSCPSSTAVQPELVQTQIAKQRVRASEQAAVIRAQEARPVAAQAERGWLGVRIQTLTEQRARYAGVDADWGVLVLGLQSQMPAHTSGFRPYDVVTHVNKRAVRSACQLKRRITSQKPGSRVAVRVIRDGVPVVLYPTLTAAPEGLARGCGCGK